MTKFKVSVNKTRNKNNELKYYTHLADCLTFGNRNNDKEARRAKPRRHKL